MHATSCHSLSFIIYTVAIRGASVSSTHLSGDCVWPEYMLKISYLVQIIARFSAEGVLIVAGALTMSHGRRQGRGQQAFEDLLDPAYLDEDLLASNGGRKAAVKQASRKKEAKAKLPGFRFKDSPAPAGGRNGPGMRSCSLFARSSATGPAEFQSIRQHCLVSSYSGKG